MHKSMRRYGEWALVTGASSGIGKAMAERLSKDGVNCVLVSEDSEKLTEVGEYLTGTYRTKTVVCCCDLARDGFMDVINSKISGTEIDILICCASFGKLGPFHSAELETYTDIIKLNAMAYLILSYEMLKGMKERNRGAVVFVSSANAYCPAGYSAVYTASKAFELYLGEALWQEANIEKSGIDILTICASATKTNFQARAGTRVLDWAWEPARVVEAGLKALGRKPSVAISIPGKGYYLLTKILPRRLGILFVTWAITSSLGKKDYLKMIRVGEQKKQSKN